MARDEFASAVKAVSFEIRDEKGHINGEEWLKGCLVRGLSPLKAAEKAERWLRGGELAEVRRGVFRWV